MADAPDQLKATFSDLMEQRIRLLDLRTHAERRLLETEIALAQIGDLDAVRRDKQADEAVSQRTTNPVTTHHVNAIGHKVNHVQQRARTIQDKILFVLENHRGEALPIVQIMELASPYFVTPINVSSFKQNLSRMAENCQLTRVKKGVYMLPHA